MYTEEQLEQAFYAGKEYAHAARNGQPTIGLRFADFKENLVKESDSLPCVSVSAVRKALSRYVLSEDALEEAKSLNEIARLLQIAKTTDNPQFWDWEKYSR